MNTVFIKHEQQWRKSQMAPINLLWIRFRSDAHVDRKELSISVKGCWPGDTRPFYNTVSKYHLTVLNPWGTNAEGSSLNVSLTLCDYKWSSLSEPRLAPALLWVPGQSPRPMCLLRVFHGRYCYWWREDSLALLVFNCVCSKTFIHGNYWRDCGWCFSIPCNNTSGI